MKQKTAKLPSSKELVKGLSDLAKEAEKASGYTIGSITSKKCNDNNIMKHVREGKRSLTFTLYERLRLVFTEVIKTGKV